MMPAFWTAQERVELSQGDYLTNCSIPDLTNELDTAGSSAEIPVRKGDLIVVTQSCDLVNLKAGLVALCPISSLAYFENANPSFAKKGVWEEVRKGRREGLYLLASPTNPAVSREARVVNFREIYSLPIGYLQRHATALGSRWRLHSPFLEHFSQAFARFFMRVGLPSMIPPFTD